LSLLYEEIHFSNRSRDLRASVMSQKSSPQLRKAATELFPTALKRRTSCSPPASTMAERFLDLDWYNQVQSAEHQLIHTPSTCSCPETPGPSASSEEPATDEMVGKKSGKALLREEGTRSSSIYDGIEAYTSHRPCKNRQWNEADELAGSAHDKPEELLHVCTPGHCPIIYRVWYCSRAQLPTPKPCIPLNRADQLQRVHEERWPDPFVAPSR
jgi:hypothetical protein